MYPILGKRFSKEGYFVFYDKFSIDNEELEHNRVDILACKWGSDDLLDVIGVECKLESSAKRSTLHSVQQALEYQTSLPSVYICSQKGELGHLRSILINLKIGHFSIDGRKKVEKQITAKKGELFDPDFFHDRIKDRLTIVLGFKDIFGESEFKHGNFDTGRGWVAKEFDYFLQFNCFFRENGVYSGFNLERKPGFSECYDRFDKEFYNLVKKLPQNYTLDCFSYKRIPKKDEDEHIDSIDSVKIKNFKHTHLDDAKELIRDSLKRRDMNERVQFVINKRLWNTSQYLSKNEYVDKIKVGYEEIKPLIDHLRN